MTEHDPDEPKRSTYDQTHDEAPARFRADHPEDQFVGASGVLFEQAMAQTRMAICLCDPHQEDLPIVFANRAFRELTGYPEEEIVGRNCRFLQGPGTDQAAVQRIRDALAKEEVLVVELKNYRYDGTPFWNALHIGPIYDPDGKLIYFFGSQWDVTEVHTARAEERQARALNRELSHRMKNMFAVISSIINMVGRARGESETARAINERIIALGRTYETTLDARDADSIGLATTVGAVVDVHDDGEGRITKQGPDIEVPFSLVSVIGLVLHELSANAATYGALSNADGKVAIRWKMINGDRPRALELRWEESGGPKLSGEAEPGGGALIVDRMMSQLGGCLEREWREDGLVATLTVPV